MIWEHHGRCSSACAPSNHTLHGLPVDSRRAMTFTGAMTLIGAKVASHGTAYEYHVSSNTQGKFRMLG